MLGFEKQSFQKDSTDTSSPVSTRNPNDNFMRGFRKVKVWNLFGLESSDPDRAHPHVYVITRNQAEISIARPVMKVTSQFWIVANRFDGRMSACSQLLPKKWQIKVRINVHNSNVRRECIRQEASPLLSVSAFLWQNYYPVQRHIHVTSTPRLVTIDLEHFPTEVDTGSASMRSIAAR